MTPDDVSSHIMTINMKTVMKEVKIDTVEFYVKIMTKKNGWA